MKFVQLKIYDIHGNAVATLVDDYKPVGNYEVDFNASQLSSGVYFYQLKAGEFVQTKKTIINEMIDIDFSASLKRKYSD